MWHVAVPLARLLVRHGRAREVIAVMRELADSPGGAEDWIVGTLCYLYADHGRAHDALAYLDALRARRGGEEGWEFFGTRLALMAGLGLVDEALELARAHPEGSTWYAAWGISEVLAGAGRTEEAVAVLERGAPANGTLLARHFIDLGRVQDAVQVLQRPPAPAQDPVYGAEPPF
ncbi:hypothetical protein SAMN05216371_8229 [Streptomyces sp. TLI_053]|uniref:tetratricopeptide repeat protein n=1 Tax=Streptomyces sp. TLI_053 TaxID=1855352 RepID=UPI00087958CA|nr:hypothetical protein [Streptomyces sp. TLI_053]SDT83404.1 hypothetical protein SAMN05216371_8229 [Streptomyces sp. TLI_053]